MAFRLPVGAHDGSPQVAWQFRCRGQLYPIKKRKETSGRRALIGLSASACALLALALGQDANYDQQNYHFYAPYALLNNRILYDIFPAFAGPTFANPIPYLPFYWLAWNAPPMFIGGLLGALYGLACAPLYLLARTVPPVPARRSGPAAMVLAVLGLTGAVAIAESGTTFIDNLMSG